MPTKPWLAHYDSDVPASLGPYPERTLLHYLDDCARERPANPALLFKGATVTYEQWNRTSDACAAALVAMGIRPGDRVALVLPNIPQFFIAEFGIWKAGATVVPLNPLYAEREFEQALSATGAETVIAMTRFYNRLKAVQPRTSVRRVIATSIKEYLPSVLRMLFTLLKERKEGDRIALAAGDRWMADLMAQHRNDPRPAIEVHPDAPAVILSSGGTTGTPKGVVGLHRHYVASGLQLNAWTRSARREWDDAIVLPLPMFHVYANVGVQPLALVGKNPLSLVPNPRDIGDVLKTIRQVKPACFNGVPTLYTAILNHPDVKAGKVDFRSIKLCVCGASALLAETKKQFETLTGATIVEGYSLTEGMMACCINPVKGTHKLGSIGLPLPDVEVRIVDSDSGEKELPYGEVGEMILRAPQYMAGYWNNPGETTLTLRTHGSGGPWVYTGDLAYMDPEGYLFIVDRKKDMIKTSGFQVWPREIEEILASHPAVMEVGVAGVPDPVKGEVAKAWVVRKPGHEVTADELRAFCKERLTPYKVPSSVEFRTELPKTLVGKVLRRELAASSRSL